MKKVSVVVKDIIDSSPFLIEAIHEDIANYSKIARKIKKDVEEKLMFPVTETSILLALKRMKSLNAKGQSTSVKVIDITVKSKLMEYIYVNPSEPLQIQQQIIKKANELEKGGYFNITRGNNETIVILSSGIEKEVDKILSKQKIIRKVKNLSSIIITSSRDSMISSGVYYPIFKKLAWEGISIIEVNSVASGLNFVFQESDVERAFSAIKSVSE